jgi:hypothetical protein
MESSEMLEWCLKLIGTNDQRKLEEEYLPEKVQMKLETKLLELLTDKCKQNKLDIMILREDKQARFFYQTLKQLGKI